MAIFVPTDIRQANQHTRIIWYCRTQGWINRARAGRDIFVAELSTRFLELEKKGYIIDRKPGPGRMVIYKILGGPGIDNGQLGLGLGGK